MSAAPIACMLSEHDLKTRMQWLAQLNRTSLVDSSRNDLCLSLTYKPDALNDVRRMVEQERACCPFLSFEIFERGNAAIVAITAPEEARDVAEEVFAPFTQAEVEALGCDCCGGGQ